MNYQQETGHQYSLTVDIGLDRCMEILVLNYHNLYMTPDVEFQVNLSNL